MELKRAYRTRILVCVASINRTFMELKLNSISNIGDFSYGINRTFMELKHH